MGVQAVRPRNFRDRFTSWQTTYYVRAGSALCQVTTFKPSGSSVMFNPLGIFFPRHNHRQ